MINREKFGDNGKNISILLILNSWMIAFLLNCPNYSKVSIYFFKVNKKDEKKKILEERLFKIQSMALQYPYLEDDYFIEKWNDFVESYRKSDFSNLTEEEKYRYLQYKQYCEMIFNLLALAVEFYKTEKKILEFVDFKSWVRTHKNWWKNPLDEYSNHDTYNEKMVEIVERWIR